MVQEFMPRMIQCTSLTISWSIQNLKTHQEGRKEVHYFSDVGVGMAVDMVMDVVLGDMAVGTVTDVAMGDMDVVLVEDMDMEAMAMEDMGDMELGMDDYYGLG